MRLFLSSYRAGNHSDKLAELFGKGTRVAMVSNARDYKTPEERKVKVDEVLQFLTDLDLKPKELDLRKYLTSQVFSKVELEKYGAIWLAGGNVFLLRRALKQSGLDILLGDAVRKNEMVYGGESAGAIIAGPTLKYSEMEGDEDSPTFVVEGYQKEPIWGGLHFIDYVPVPHFRDVDYGQEIDKYIDRLDKANLRYKAMTNDQALVINGDKEDFLK